ncbi:MAG: DegV family EDD domain-containing protein [Lachnospiraceae bacterium]|nr:DegV family EDD domain-containing protein [Lachnospiraceae bacterium]
MNNNIIISADCICDLPESLVEEYSIRMLPFYIEMKDVRFQDYTEVDFSSMYDYLKQDDVKVSSVPAAIEDYRNHFMELTKNEDEAIIHICVSRKISEAYNHAVVAAQDMEHVFVVDSGSISHGIGLLVLKAVEMARTHSEPNVIVDELHKAKKRISCSCVLKTTQYIANNKRVNQTISNLLDIFHIKPIIKLKNGAMKVRGVCLGTREYYVKKYIRQIFRNRKAICEDVLFITVLSDSEELRELVYREATEKIEWKHVYMQDVSATNLCNVGLGSVGLMFYTK